MKTQCRTVFCSKWKLFLPVGLLLFCSFSIAATLTNSPEWSVEMEDRPYCQFGYSLSAAGDVNGDGFEDIIILADNYNYGSDEEDQVFIYYGSSDGPGPTADWTVAGERFSGVSAAGDVNGDGYSDVLIGDLSYSSFYENTGNIFIYYGSVTGPEDTPGSVLTFGDGAEHPHLSDYAAGDVNGDGYSDIIVGYPQYSNGESEEGCLLVYYGSTSGPGSSADEVIESDQENGWLGRSVTVAGDLNGDEIVDVIAGAQNLAKTVSGKIYAFHGSLSGLSSTADWVFQETEPSYFGPTGYPAGDVNGDGYCDIVIQDRTQQADYAANYDSYSLCCGSLSGLNSESALLFRSVDEEIDYGIIAAAGDLNGDGFADLIAFAETDYFEDLDTDEFIYLQDNVFIYYGSASGITGDDADWVIEYDIEDTGHWVDPKTAGDVDGDGSSEMLIGLPSYEPSGRVLLYGEPFTPEDNDTDDSDDTGGDGGDDDGGGGCFISSVFHNTP